MMLSRTERDAEILRIGKYGGTAFGVRPQTVPSDIERTFRS
jgi:hypothetical protein